MAREEEYKDDLSVFLWHRLCCFYARFVAFMAGPPRGGGGGGGGGAHFILEWHRRRRPRPRPRPRARASPNWSIGEREGRKCLTGISMRLRVYAGSFLLSSFYRSTRCEGHSAPATSINHFSINMGDGIIPKICDRRLKPLPAGTKASAERIAAATRLFSPPRNGLVLVGRGAGAGGGDRN